MRTLWPMLHSTLMETANTSTLEQAFEGLRQAEPALRRFVDTAALLDHLHAPGGDRDDKNAILAALVRQVQRRGPTGGAAMTLMWLALWPGLDAVYRRLWRHRGLSPDELAAEIVDRFLVQIHGLVLDRVQRIAATVLMNVERDIRSAADRRGGKQGAGLWPQTPPSADSVLGVPPGCDAETAVTVLRHVLGRWIGGGDADLLITVVVVGETQRTAAERLGISHDAGRKRLQRALRRLRELLQSAC